MNLGVASYYSTVLPYAPDVCTELGKCGRRTYRPKDYPWAGLTSYVQYVLRTTGRLPRNSSLASTMPPDAAGSGESTADSGEVVIGLGSLVLAPTYRLRSGSASTRSN